jgi:hypothetical protein
VLILEVKHKLNYQKGGTRDMDDNKVFDDKPLKDAASGSAKPESSEAVEAISNNNIQPQDLNEQDNFAASQFAYSKPEVEPEPKLNDQQNKSNINSEQTIASTSNVDGLKIDIEHEEGALGPMQNQPQVDPPGPRLAYDHPEIAPDHQQTYEESMASANMANQISNQTESKNHRSIAKMITLSLIAVLLIAGIITGAYFYIKITSSPKYVVGKSFENLANNKFDISVLYQTKNGNVYDDKLKIDEKYDGNNNKTNSIAANLDDSKIINLNLSSYQSENYLKFSGLQASAAYFQPYSQSLSQTVGSSGVVLDNQWVKLNNEQSMPLPTDIVRSSYGIVDAVDQDSITLTQEQGETATYSFRFNRAMFNSAVNQFINGNNFNYLESFNFQNQINSMLENKDVNQLKFSITLNRKFKTVEKITISDQNQVHIVSLSFKSHENQTVDKPTQAKNYNEVAPELQAATSQSGVDLGPMLSQ